MGGERTVSLRPLTVGELLDAAFTLLRAHFLALLASGVVLAVLESALLYPLRLAGLASVTGYLAAPTHGFGWYWLVVAAGLGTESAAVTVLAGLAAQSVIPTLTGLPTGGTSRLHLSGRGARLGPLLLLALLVGVVGAAGALLLLLGWVLWWAYTGLAGPASTLDTRVVPAAPAPGHRLRPLGPAGALRRSLVLVTRARFRPGAIRLLGYLAWYAIRLALGFGGVQALGLVLHDPAARTWITLAVWVAVNAVAYPALGCLDAVTHLETRVRVEGLDIALSRAVRRGMPVEPVLAVPG